MAGYVISNNTVSFLQFDDPNDILKDNISNNQNKWNTKEDDRTYSLVKSKRISKPYSLQLYSFYETSYEGNKVFYFGQIVYSYRNTNLSESSFTLDFWCSKDTGIRIDYVLSDPDYMKNNNDKEHNTNSPNEFMLLYMNRTGFIETPYSSTTVRNDDLQISGSNSNKYNHIAITFDSKTKKLSIFYNGKLFISGIITNNLYEEIQKFIRKNNYYTDHFFKFTIFADIGYLAYPSKDATLLIDNLRLSNKVLWDKDFFPPGIVGYQTFVHGDNAYGVKDGSIILLSSNWSSLSNNTKATKIQDLDFDVLPKVSDMIAKSSDGNISKVESYQVDAGTPNLVIKSAGKKVETVYQNTLLDLSKFISVDKIVPDYTITNSSTIRVAITTDLLTYKTYNFNTSSWETIDKSKVVSDGIPINKLDSIPKNSLAELGRKIAFAYTIILDNSETDTCQINSISIATSSDEKWTKTKQEDQSYGYLNSKVLQITFSKSGDYKVNYNNSNDSI